MPWKERHLVMERMLFINRLQSGEKMVDLCLEFGISRKTGYKFLERFQKYGEAGLFNQSKRPIRFSILGGRDLFQAMVSMQHQLKIPNQTRKVRPKFFRQVSALIANYCLISDT